MAVFYWFVKQRKKFSTFWGCWNPLIPSPKFGSRLSFNIAIFHCSDEANISRPKSFLKASISVIYACSIFSAPPCSNGVCKECTCCVQSVQFVRCTLMTVKQSPVRTSLDFVLHQFIFDRQTFCRAGELVRLSGQKVEGQRSQRPDLGPSVWMLYSVN